MKNEHDKDINDVGPFEGLPVGCFYWVLIMMGLIFWGSIYLIFK